MHLVDVLACDMDLAADYGLAFNLIALLRRPALGGYIEASTDSSVPGHRPKRFYFCRELRFI